MRKWPTFQLSRDLSLATSTAKVFMLKRAARRLGLADAMAGLYVAQFDKICAYWKSTTSLKLMANSCGVVDPIWTYQHEFYHLMTCKTSPLMNRLVLYDREFLRVLSRAEEMARKMKQSQDEAVIMVEHVLLAIVTFPENALCHEIISSGLVPQKVRRGLANSLKIRV